MLLLSIPAQAAISWVATGATAFSTGSNNRALVVPAIVDNDLLVAHVAIRGSRTITRPTGWTLIDQVYVSGTNITQGVYYKAGLASDSGTTVSWNFNASDDNAGVIRAYRGVDTAAPIGNFSGNINGGNSSATLTALSITTTVADEWILTFYGVADGAANPVTTPGGMAERYDFDNGGGNNGLSLAGDDEARPTAGATGNRVSTSSQSDRYVAQLVALKPIAVPLAEYRMDQAFWNGTANEVADSSGNGNHAQAFNGASTVGTNPAITGNPGTCNYGVFDNGGTITQGYVQTPLPNLITDFTVTAWIRTTSTLGGQRIFIDDQGVLPATGYGISLGDGTPGRIRFYSRGLGANTTFDSTYTMATIKWYFIAAVADITNKKRTIYVFSDQGALLDVSTEAAWTGGAWGTDGGPVSIGGETNASGESPATFHFRGNLDEVRVYQQALGQAAVTAIATQTHPCAAVIAVPNHYELSLPTNSIACLATTVTVTACTDATSPCTPFAAASGTTAILATSGGTLGVTPVTFGATGVASTTLSYPAAPDNTLVTVTLSGEQIAAGNFRQWCPNGTACVVANSGSTTFNTTGFIFSATAGGPEVATIPTQVAGVTSGANYLRAVKTNPTTQACEAALTGTSAVNFAYECNNPTSCYTSNLMSVNGGTATTIARNNNGSVSSYLPVNMTFDANGNAPFTFNYSDVGQVKLWVSKLPGGTLLSTLTGSSSSFVVKPGGFAISNIKQTAAPQLVNPAGAKFVKASENFTLNVSATTTPASGATITPNYGRELTPESVKLTSALVAPAAGAVGTFSGTVGAFTNGVATGTTFNWSEVGIIALTASVGDADYLGAGDTTGTPTGNVGRFFPDHFNTYVLSLSGLPMPCPTGLTCPPSYNGLVYSGQPFSAQIIAKNAANATTQNYDGTALGFSKAVTLSAWNAVGGAAQNPSAGTLSSASVASTAFSFGATPSTVPTAITQNYSLPNLSAPTNIYLRAVDTDAVTSLLAVPANSVEGGVSVANGWLRLFNNFGSEKSSLGLNVIAQFWSGKSWVLSSTDFTTAIPATSVALSNYRDSTSAPTATWTTTASGPGTLSLGQGTLTLSAPFPAGKTGCVDVAINLGTATQDTSCLAIHPAMTAPASSLAWLRGQNGNCLASTTYAADPSASACFGVYSPETKRTIHVRELF